MILKISEIIYFIAVVLLLFNLTIFIHELGHFLIGRWRGAKIERFAIWFGPAIWSKVINGVEFRLGCIPLGGYVAFPQLAMEAVEGKSETPTEDIKPLKPKDKIPILLAGSVFNIFLAFAVACIVWVVGLPKDASILDLKVGYVPSGSPEQAAGVQPGDEIVSINGKAVNDWEEVMQRVALSLSESIHLGVKRDGELKFFDLKPNRDSFFEIRKLELGPSSTPVAGEIMEGSPAEKAGVKTDDKFLMIDNEKILGTYQMMALITKRANKPTQFTILRKGEQLQLEITPKMEEEQKKPMIGIVFKSEENIKTVYPNPIAQIVRSVLLMADTFNALLHSKATGVGAKDLSGPLGIGKHIFDTLRMDFRLALSFMVMLNINLAVINLLPIPVLDGGHIVFTIIEAIRRKPLNQKVMEVVQTIFVVLLVGLMLYVTFHDVRRFKKHGLFSSPPAKEETPKVFKEKK
jgi:regulator of sigma E protease